MAESPFASDIYDDTGYFTAAERLPAGHPTRAVEALRNKLPEENKSLPKPRFFMDPKAISLTNMIRGSMDTVGRWLEGKPKIGEDTISPLGAAGVTGVAARNLAAKPATSTLSAFIGPGQAARLDRTPGSLGSLEALEAAQKIWAKGGTTPEGLAETWGKHGWAPPESFGVRGQPFTWLEMPDLRIRDKLMDEHVEALSQGRMHTTDGRLADAIQPGRDLDRLLMSTPELANMAVRYRTAPEISYFGAAGTAAPRGQPPLEQTLKAADDVPPPNYVVGYGPNPNAAESIMLGHELRGHAVPQWGDTQIQTKAERQARPMPIHDTVAADKLTKARDEARAHSNKLYADPSVPPFERSIASRWVDRLKEMKDEAGRHAAYFGMPEERMARHAHILDQLERQGGNPFQANRAPGVMSTYGSRGIVSDKVFDDLIGAEGIYKLRDLKPRSLPLSADDLAPFMAGVK
jgi:hypothetical protein